ncbi:MAG: serine hydrolase [Candidatus Sericytochromatia bacterium]|nr:serine hydrolase [Candidatus Sericytochromatia bacterium]
MPPARATATTGQLRLATGAPALVSPASPGQRDPALQAKLEELIKRNGLEGAGVSLRNLETGTFAAVNEQASFGSASTIKVPLMAAVMQLVEAGKLDLSQQVTVKASNVTRTWEPPGDKRPILRGGERVTVEHLVDLMISRSDNTATNTLMDLVDRNAVAAGFGSLGMPRTQLGKKLYWGNRVPDTPRGAGQNVTTAGDMAQLFQRIADGTAVSPGASEKMRGWLRGQLDHDKIARGLPPGATFYGKSGETSKVTHDVGIVEVGGQRYVLAVMTKMNVDNSNVQQRIAGLSRDLLGAMQAQSAATARAQQAPAAAPPAGVPVVAAAPLTAEPAPAVAAAPVPLPTAPAQAAPAT